eukprot:COSAG03_NODE_22475_length_290_cov_1.361257_1_plen_48_part_01
MLATTRFVAAPSPPQAAQKPSAEPTLVQNSNPALKSKFVAFGSVVTTG